MPQRFLRPGIRTSEAWNKATYSAQSLYISIMTLVDDFGRYDGRAALLHGECRSLRVDSKPQETAADLRQLDQLGLIQLYQFEGKEYLQVLKWQERTRSDHSKFPVPPQETAGIRSIPQGKDASLAIVPSPLSHKPSHTPNGNKRRLTDEEFVCELKNNPAYSHIDIDRELSKMDAWLMGPKGRGRSKTRKFILNWLNNADAPVVTTTSIAKPKGDPDRWQEFLTVFEGGTCVEIHPHFETAPKSMQDDYKNWKSR